MFLISSPVCFSLWKLEYYGLLVDPNHNKFKARYEIKDLFFPTSSSNSGNREDSKKDK